MKRGSLGRFAWVLLVILAVCLPILSQAQDGACNHQWEIVYIAKEPTCTEKGLGTYCCTVCKAQERRDIPANGHTPETVPGRAATCTEPGLTDGSKCSVCGAVLSAQTEIPATGHIPETVPGRAATCTEAGLTDGSKCSVCGMVITRQTEIPATGHTPETIPGRAATCTEAGLTDGSRCAVCGTVLSVQTEIPATGHSWDGGTVTTAPTCTANGTRTYTCTRCGAAYTESIPAAGHTPEVIPASAPTCAAPGKTEGSRCSVCGTILTAQADIPALAHQWGSWYTDRAATCTEHGQEFSTCLKCGAVRWQDISPLGHEWDEGTVIREAGYLEEGEITYTCLRDESHTKTEAIPVKEPPGEGSVMNLMRNGPPSLPDSPEGGEPIFVTSLDVPLIITKQPESGKVKRESNKALILTVEAAGGTPPYTYQWYYAEDTALMDELSEAIAEKAGKVADIYNKAHMGIGEWLKKNGGEKPGLPAAETRTNAQLEGIPDYSQEIFPYGHACENGTGPSYAALEGGRRYWCVVRDAENERVVSKEAKVGWGVRILGQPGNTNFKFNENMYAFAVEGVPPYTYVWGYLMENGAYKMEASGEDLILTEEWIGRTVKCFVTDSEGDTDESDEAVVYTANDFLEIRCSSPVYLREGETAELSAIVNGGVEPYTVTWSYGNEEHPTEYKEDGRYCMTVTSHDKNYLLVRFTVTDAVGETASCKTFMDYRQLTISEQPEGGRLARGGSHELSIAVEDGQAPFTYTLFNSAGDNQVRENMGPECSFIVSEPAWYSVYVEDANGDYALSGDAVVEAYQSVYIEDYTDYVSSDNEGVARLSVKAAGGKGPYQYEWHQQMRTEDYQWKSTDAELADMPDISTGMLGPDLRYYCVVKDSNGDKAVTGYMTAEYGGKKPRITEQPKGGELEYNPDGKYEIRMTCSAYTGEYNEDQIIYEWHRVVDGQDHMLSRKEGGQEFRDSGPIYAMTGKFYCVAENPKTGRITGSNKVAWRLLPAFTGAEQPDLEPYIVFRFISGRHLFVDRIYSEHPDEKGRTDWMEKKYYRTERRGSFDLSDLTVTLSNVPMYYIDENGNKQSHVYHVVVTDNDYKTEGSHRCTWVAITLEW